SGVTSSGAGSAREPYRRNCDRHRLGSMYPACRMDLLSFLRELKLSSCSMSPREEDRAKHEITDLDRSASLIRPLLAGIFLFGWMSASTDAAEVNIGYLRRTDPKSTLSLIQTPANNDGIAGARLAIDDNNTTGRFLNQQFSLEDVRLAGGGDAL